MLFLGERVLNSSFFPRGLLALSTPPGIIRSAVSVSGSAVVLGHSLWLSRGPRPQSLAQRGSLQFAASTVRFRYYRV